MKRKLFSDFKIDSTTLAGPKGATFEVNTRDKIDVGAAAATG